MSGRKRAVEVVLVRTGREKREQEQLQKVKYWSLITGSIPGIVSVSNRFNSLSIVITS